MGTPLYSTDVIPATSRPTLTVMDDGDYFLVFDTSTAKISKILKTNVVLPASQASYDNTSSGLTATQVQAALDELVVNLGSSDSAISALAGRLDTLEGTGYTEGSLKSHEDRLDTLEGTGAGSVAKAIDDALEQIETDKTLAVSGMAADAKVTGDKVGELKSAFNTYTEDNSSHLIKKTISRIALTLTKGKGVLKQDYSPYGVRGDVIDAANTYACTDLLKIPEGTEKLYTNIVTQSTMNYGWCIYDAGMNVISSGYKGYIDLGSYKNAIFLRATCYKSNETFSDMVIEFENDNSIQEAVITGKVFTEVSGIGMNVFNSESLISNRLMDTLGVVGYDASFSIVFIKKETNDFVRIRSNYQMYRCCLYDASFNFLSQQTSKYAVNISSATYIGISFANASTTFESLMLIFTNENSSNDTTNLLSGIDYIPFGRNALDKNIEGIYKNIITFDDIINCLIRQQQKTYTIAVNSQGLKQVTFTGSTSNITQMQYDYPCLPGKIVCLEYNAMSNEPDVDYTYTTGAILYITFLDKNGNAIGSKYNSSICGASRCAYHRTQYISPVGTKKLRLTLVTRKNTNAVFTNLAVSIIESAPTRENGVILDGHLGSTNVAPRNTLPAFELLSKEGFKSCIMNVNRTKDKILVALHNDTIDSTSDGTGNVYDFTYQELQAYDFGSWFNAVYTGTKIPTIEQVTKLFASNGITPMYRLQSDLTTEQYQTDYFEPLHDLIIKYGFKGKAVIKAFSMDVLQSAYEVIGNDALYIYCANITSTNIELCTSFDGDITLEAQGDSVTQEWADRAIESGVKLSAYTVSDPKEMKHLIALGITRFCTDGGANVAIPAD